MQVGRILYHPDFIRDLQKIDFAIQNRAIKSEQLFRKNPLHPSLRLHSLKGKLNGFWSVSVTMKIRIIFLRRDTGDIVFLSIGHHNVYSV